MEHRFDRDEKLVCSDCGISMGRFAALGEPCRPKLVRRQLIAAAHDHEGADYGD